MSVTAEQAHAAPGHHAPPEGFIQRWIFSKDHKVIGIQYYFLALFAVFLGMSLSLVMRIQLAFPAQIAGMAESLPDWLVAALLDPSFYLKMVTMHGTIMVFMVLTTAPQGGFGNYFLPIQIGALDMAFPTLNMLSFWTTFLALVILVAAFFVPAGAPLGGWTGYPPLSALGEIAGPGQGWGVNLWILSIAVFCLASLLGALNFISTTLAMRAKGMSLMRMPLTVWAWFTTAVLSLLAFPVLLGGGILLLMDRLAGTSFFLPAGLVVAGEAIDRGGGSPILWQHLFWFFGHPEVYIAILPGMGAVSNILSTFARKPIFGYKAMVIAIFAIGGLGFFVWGHHMFMSGMSPFSAMTFSLVTLTIGVPSAVKTVNWLGTLWGARIRFDSPMIYALAFVSLFVTGGLSGIFLGQTSVDFWFHDTYFVVGHFHMIMGVAALFGIFAATVFWFPKMFGRMMNEPLSKIHAVLTFIGVYLVFVPMHAMGLAGHPRRYYDSSAYEFLTNANSLHVFVTWAAIFTAAVQLIFLFNFLWSLFRGPRATDNPWDATTLEWSTTSPPPFDNFGGVEPVVHHGPYEFAVPGAERDFVMQTDPPSAIPARH
ncbi:MAG: cbb3-type cytochrome c oxidase subunit I [Acidobacteriota bacterium]|jgi:cytochrome c oxidase subunit 1